MIENIMSTDSPEINIPPAFAEKFWLSFWVALTFLSRFYFLDMGFGRPDAWRVGVTGKFLIESGTYIPSRPPGFPLVEMVSAMSYAIFGTSPNTWIMANGLTCLIFCASVAGIWALARRWGVKSALMIAAIYTFAPLNWVYSVETIDYLWMASLVVFSVLAAESDNKRAGLWAGIFLGLAASARFFAVLLIIPILILAWTRHKSAKELRTIIISSAVVALGFYSVVFFQIKDFTEYVDWFHELNRVSAGLAKLEGGTLAKRFLMPAVGLFGPLATIALIVAGLSGLKNFISGFRSKDRGIRGPLMLAIFIMLPYLWHLHPNYWIPATGFLLIILARSANTRVTAIAGLLIIAANFPWWQTNIEGMKIISPGGRNPKIESWGMTLAPYQNETVFAESSERERILIDVDEFLAGDIPSDWVIMANLRLPIIQFIVPGIREIDLPLANGESIKVWGRADEGPYWRYMLSPNQVKNVTDSGFHAVYLPGMESTYLATYGVPIEQVEGVEVIYRESGI